MRNEQVQWKTGQVRWYPAGNLQIGGYISKSPTRPTDASLEDLIFEPGDRVRIKTTISVSQRDVWQNVKLREVGVIAGAHMTLTFWLTGSFNLMTFQMST